MTNFDEIFEKYTILELLEFNGLEELPKELEKITLLKKGCYHLQLKKRYLKENF